MRKTNAVNAALLGAIMLAEASENRRVYLAKRSPRYCGQCAYCPNGGATRCRMKNRAVTKTTPATNCGQFREK